MASVSISEFLRRIGEPSFEEDPNTGLKKLTRRYVVDIEGVEIANLEAKVLDVIGNTDTEYPTYYLIEQRLEGRESEAGPILTRVFQELDSGSGLTKSGGDKIERLDNGLYRVTQTFIGLKGSADDIAGLDDAVGVETYIIPNLTPEVSVTLANWQRDVISDTIVRYTKVYQQPGILRVDINEKYGREPYDNASPKPTLIEYTVTGFLIEDSDVTAALLGDPYNNGTKPPGPFDVSKDNYHGMEVVRLRYVLGMGIISASESVKAGSTANVVEHVLVSINIPPSEYLQAGNSYTGTGASGGSVTYDSAWLGTVGLNSLSTSARDDYILYTARYISIDNAAGYVGGSSGGNVTLDGASISIASDWDTFAVPADSILSDQTTQEYGGNVQVRRITFIADLKVGEDLDDLLGAAVTISDDITDPNYVVVGVKVQVYPGYSTGEFTLAQGSGVVSVTRDSRFADVREGFDGGVVHQVTAINVNPTEVGVFDQGGRTYDFTGAKVIQSTVKDTVYGPLYTMEIYDGEAITGLSRNFKYDGALEITTITGLNLNPLDVYGLQYGNVADHEVTVSKYGTQYKYIFARGQGEISRETSTRYDQQVLVTTLKTLNLVPTVPDGAYLISTQIDSDDYGDVYTWVWAEGSGLISVEEEQRYDGKLTIYTVKTINESFTIPEGPDSYLISTKMEEGNYGEVYTTRYAVGSGLIKSSETSRYNGNLTIVTDQYLNDPQSADSLGPAGVEVYVMDTSVESSTYGDIYTYKYAYGEGELETKWETRYNGKVQLYTTVWLNALPEIPEGSNIVSRKLDSADYGEVHTWQYLDGVNPVELSQSIRYLYDRQLRITKIESLNQPVDTPAGALEISRSSRDSQYGTVFTIEYAEGSGLIDTKTEGRYRDENGETQLQIVTERWLNESPVLPPGKMLISEGREEGQYGEMFTIRYASGEGKLFSSIEERYDGKLLIYTARWLNMEADDIPESAAIIETKTETSDYGTIYTYRYAQGQGGFLEERISYRYDRKLKITVRTYLNETPPEPGEGELQVSVRQEDGPYGTIYTQELASGSGEISSSTSDIYPGLLERVTKRYLNTNPDIPNGAVLIEESSEDGTYGTFHTKSYAIGEGGLIESMDESRYDGALQITTERWIKKSPSANGRVLINTSQDSTPYGEVVTYRFASGEGRIASQVEERFGGTLLVYTQTFLNQTPYVDPNQDAVLSTRTRSETFGTIFEIKFARGRGLLSTNTRTRFNGNLTITEQKWLNERGTVPPDVYLMSTDIATEDYGTVYTYVWASGAGEIDRTTTRKYHSSTSGTGLLTVLTIKSLNVPPVDPPGYTLAKTETSLEDYGTVYTYEYASGQGILSLNESVRLSDSNGNPVVYNYTVRSLNFLPDPAEAGLPATARLIGTSDQTGDYGTTYTQTFTDGKGWLSTSENFPYPDKPDIVVYTVRHANEEPVPPSNAVNPRSITSRVNEGAEVTIYTSVYATGSGLIGESSSERYNGRVKVNTYRFLSEVDDTAVTGTITREEVSVGQYGDIFTVTAVELDPPFILSETHTEIMPGVIRHVLLTLVEAPRDYTGTAGGVVTEISSEISQSELGSQYRTTFIEAVNGTEVSTSTSQQASGAETVTAVVVGPVDNPRTPSGTFLTDLRQEERPGYILTTYQYLRPPNTYSLDSNRTIQYPGFVQADSTTIQGYRVMRAPEMRTVDSTVEVEFTDRPPPSIDNSSLLNPRAFVSVRVVGSQAGVDPTGYSTKSMSGFWASNTTAFYNAATETVEGFFVAGSAKVEGTASYMGSTLILGRVVTPFFFTGGTQIYKVTTETLRL